MAKEKQSRRPPPGPRALPRYVLPLAVGVGVAGPDAPWDESYYATLAGRVGGAGLQVPLERARRGSGSV